MRFLTLALALGVGVGTVQAQQACVVTPLQYGNVCKCTETVCDSVTPLGALTTNQVAVYETESNSNHFLTRVSDLSFKPAPPIPGIQDIIGAGTLKLDVTTQYQKITGFGGAFTDAAALTWANMTTKIQSLLIDQYFSDNGLQYNLGRIPMAGTDFSTHSYSYDDTPNDFSWSQFSVAMDDPVKIPFIKQALARSSRNITLFASPWSPPAWMKWYGSAIGGGLNGAPQSTDPYFSAWAQYFVKFIDEYKKRGIQIWGVTTQNEPITGGGSNITHNIPPNLPTILPIPGIGNLLKPTPLWDSNYMTVAVQRDFIKNNLGPALKQAHPEVKLIAWDDGNADLDQVSGILSDPDAFKYVDGVGVHWYGSYEDRLPQFSKMNDVHNQYLANYPNKFILPTEACEGFLPWSAGPWPGEWDRGMTYAYDIINDLNNWGVGWTDWNLMLDMKGGPNHVGNNVDAPILLDTAVKNVFYKQPMYYALGHFSKFIPAGSARVNLIPDWIAKGWGVLGLQYVGFLTPDNNIVIVLVNIGIADLSTWIDNGNNQLVLTKVKARSIQTLIFKAASGAKIKEAAALDDVNAPSLDTITPTAGSSMLSTGAIIAISISSVLLVGMLVGAGICLKRKYAAKHATVNHIHEGQQTSTSTVEMQQL